MDSWYLIRLLLVHKVLMVLCLSVGFDVFQISMDARSVASQLKSSGLLRTQGLVGGKWSDAYDGKTMKVH